MERREEKEKILMVSPHPDDETLGCGGTLLKHGANGDILYWLIMTNVFVKEGFDNDRVAERQSEIDKVAQRYGFRKIFKLDFPTTKLDIIPKNELIKAVCDVAKEVMPQIIYLPHRNDIHSDNRETFDAVASSSKTFRISSVRRVLSYEVLSQTEFSFPVQGDTFVPNSFSDITDYIDEKISIMRIFKGEMGVHPFPRSERAIRAVATMRGAQAGFEYAEGFMLLKDKW